MVLRMVKSMVCSIAVRGRAIGTFPGPQHAVKEQDVYWRAERGVR